MKENSVLTPNGEAVSIGIDGGTQMLVKGFPDLPKVTSSVIIPDEKDMQATVVDAHYYEISNMNVAPSKGELRRTADPSSIAVNYDPIYDEDIFYPKMLTELEEPYILRDYRGQTVVAYPFQYDAKTKTLRVYSDLTIKISPVSSAGENVFVRKNSSPKIQTEFNKIYQQHFVNYQSHLRYTPLDDHGNMLIICASSFISEMQSFVDWKIQEGIKTEVVDVATIGNDAASIKNYVANYYNTKGLTFLLLVGDYAQVVSSQTSAGVSDNDYGYILGNDHYQEIFVGRFSAETSDEVTTQVNRTIEYEKNPAADSSFSKATAIGSNFGAGIGDDGESDWQHERNIRAELLAYTYTNVQELYDSTHAGGNDQPGNPSPSDLSAQINNGVGLVNYTGHGGTTNIGTTDFHVSDVEALANSSHYPFIWLVGCEAGNFKDSLCFAEAWARATYNGTPAGSIANFMSTVNQYWAPPMQMQDEANAILVESDSENIKRTFGGLSINGCFSMNDQYGQYGYDMTDTWVIFGDPSVMVRTAFPVSMNVTHDSAIFLGSNNFSVNCSAEDAFVSLTQDDSIIGTATVSGGVALVQMNPVLSYDSVTITITGFNKIPYIKKIPVVQSAGPFIVHATTTINDALGNNNGQADYGENVGLNLTIENVGASIAQNVVSVLASTDPLITITDNTESFGDVSSNAASTHENAFSLGISNNVQDGHQSFFTITSSDDLQNSWSSNYLIIVNAPALDAGSFTIDDSQGNGNGFLDPGETADIIVNNVNNGHSDAINAVGVLSCTNPYVSILNSSCNIGTIAALSSASATFQVSVNPAVPYGTDLVFDYSMNAGNYSAADSFFTTIAPAIENFETNDFTKFDWQLSGNANWFTESDDVYEGNYAARSGDITDNQSSTLEISLHVLYNDSISFFKKVSSEASFDNLKFYIDGVLKGYWSGYMNWSLSKYAVDTGLHDFKWSYVKDNSFSEGEDCGWLDEIVLPPFQSNVGTSVADPSKNNLSCYPNPFAQLTFIRYSLRENADVSIDLLNTEGKTIKKILSLERESSGDYQFGFDASGIPSGIYFCQLHIGNQVFTEKLVVNR